MKACAAEEAGEVKKALGLFQEGIRTTMAAVQVILNALTAASKCRPVLQL